MAGTDTWHSVTLSVPFPTQANAELVKRVIDVDPVLKPNELRRKLTVQGSTLRFDFEARTITQARVALDHCFSDVQLIVQTMHSFAPADESASGSGLGSNKQAEPTAPSLEVGLKGEWDGMSR